MLDVGRLNRGLDQGWLVVNHHYFVTQGKLVLTGVALLLGHGALGLINLGGCLGVFGLLLQFL